MKDLEKQIHNIFKKSDRSDWDSVKFGDVANEIKESSPEPISEGIERAVGLEHITPLDIHIRDWGNVKDGITFTRKFKKGQVLFGRRRAYQRKAALAEFDGICSGDIIVLEANEEKMDPSLLPFLVHSDKFYEWAVSTSAGSLSPRTKFKSLSEFKFKLPPRPIQKELAKIFWKIDKLGEEYREAYEKFLIVRLSYLIDSFSKASVKTVSLGKLPVNTINGLWKTKEKDAVDAMVIRSTEFGDFGEIDLSKLEPLPVSRKKFEKSRLVRGDIIVERSGGGPTQPVGRVCFFDLKDDGYSFSNFTSVIRVEEENDLVPKYLFYFLETFYERGLTDRIQKQTTGIRNLDYDLYLATKIPFPNVAKQKRIVAKIDEIELNRHSLFEQMEQIRILWTILLNRVFI